MSPRSHARRPASPPTVGLIDIGTNAVKLVVATVTNGRVVPRHFGRRPTRLGQGLAASKEISTAAARRTADAVEELAAEARAHGATDVMAAGTYALRTARNGRAIATAIGRRAGASVHILSGKEEGRLVLLAARAHMPRATRDLMVIDIGGGSAQLSLSRGRRDPIVRSVPLGAVVLTEHYLSKDPIDTRELERMRTRIDRVLSRLFAALPSGEAVNVTMIAAGGAATTAATMAGTQPAASMPSLSLATLRDIEAKCLAATIDERRHFPGMTPDRADIMPAGLVVLIAFMRHARKRSLRVFAGGWREGFILERAERARPARAKTRSTARARAAERKGR
jgi:exopolyphosphatase/guanosine-5'-triphosphate,3'-diphosphate pyrophosphatase